MQSTVITNEAEYERLWLLAVRVFPAFANYRRDAERLGRRIPIVQLCPTADHPQSPHA